MNPTDADLLTLLSRHPGALVSAQAEAGTLMRQARELAYAPIDLIDQQWLAYKQRMAAAVAPPGTNQNSAVDHAARVAMLRIAREAIEHFGAYLKMTMAQLSTLREDHKRKTVVAMQQAAAGARALSANAFDARLCVTQLAQRGVALSLARDGSLMASPTGLLSPADRKTLVAHEAALRQLLDSAERVA